MLQLCLQQTDRYPRFALPVSCPQMGQSIPALSNSIYSWPAPSLSICNQLGHASRVGLRGSRMWAGFEWQVDFAAGIEKQTPGSGAGSPTTTAWQFSPELSPGLDSHTSL